MVNASNGYQVLLANRIENTGLDGEVFSTSHEAAQAAAIVKKEYSAKGFEICVAATTRLPTITFREWNELGW